MLLATAWTALALSLSAQGPAQEPAADAPRFPASTALAEGVSPDALARLDRLVQGFVDDGEVVGAELLVVKNGRTILHTAHGWRDREEGLPMENGSVFCVRSMTKPVIGTAIRMLAQDHLLGLDDSVSRWLPSFDVEGKRAITIRELLTHTSGLPLSLILGTDPHELKSIRAVADLGGACELAFEPGTAFQYSDQGVDTLTAVVEAVTGAPAEDFVRERILAPLGMRSSTCLLRAKDPLCARACSLYVGSPGSWTRFWSPDQAPLFPIFLGSQGLYSTIEDYAGFLDLWLRHGRVGGQRLLRASAVRRALEPGPFPLGTPTGFPGLRAEYGSLMQLWTRPVDGAEGNGDGEREVVVFGHTGSDGTHAWAFPGANAMAFYFTQSRGTLTGLRVEEALGQLFLGAPFDPLQAAPPLAQFQGYYRQDAGDPYRAIVLDGDDLALEVPGRGVVALTFAGDDRWKVRQQPGTFLSFERDAGGKVVGFELVGKERRRFVPDADLPDADAVAARVARAHGLARLADLGPIRIHGRISIEKLGLTGETTTWLQWPDRWRTDEAVGDDRGSVAFDGKTLYYATGTRPLAPLEGAPAALLRPRNPLARFGDWSRWYDHVEVIEHVQRKDEDTLLVRMGDDSAPAATLYVDAKSGLVGRVDAMTYSEGLGRTGQIAEFGDYRDVSGMQLPYRTRLELANPLVGPIVVTVDSVDLGFDVPPGLFEGKD